MDDDAVLNLLSTIGMGQTLSQQFHRATRLAVGSMETPDAEWPEEWTKTYYKSYPRLPAHALPRPTLPADVSLRQILMRRRSSRAFSDTVTLEKISTLLYFSAGVRDLRHPDGPNRFYPSAGARYPLEVYLAAWEVSGLAPGLYHYYVKQHALEELLRSDMIAQGAAECLLPAWAKDGKCAIFLTAVFHRTQMKYKDRGYRHILLEAGHLCQNLALLAAAAGVGCCSCGGFVDDAVNALLDVDGREEAAITSIILG